MVIYNEEYELGIIWDISIVSSPWVYGNISSFPRFSSMPLS